MPQTASLYDIWFVRCRRSKFGDTNKKKNKKTHKYSYLRKNDPACLSKVREFRTLRVQNRASGPSARSRTLTLMMMMKMTKNTPGAYINHMLVSDGAKRRALRARRLVRPPIRAPQMVTNNRKTD